MGRFVTLASGRALAPICFVGLLAAYHFIFGPFFPTDAGYLGDDYSRVLPDLLDGFLWFKHNGIFEPFWFTPAFCGGQPAFGAPDSSYYSVPQFLAFVMDPLSSVYATVLIFAALGFWGTYALLRRCLGTSRQAAIMGGALFMFNGFYIYRMMIGHFTFHGVMLVPWAAYFLLRTARHTAASSILNGAAAGCVLAYGVYSGMIHLLLPCAFAVVGIASICAIRSGSLRPTQWLQRSMWALVVALGLSAAKLTAGFAFLSNFPRSDYALPGIVSAWDATQLVFDALFLAPADITQGTHMLLIGEQWRLDRHEWEYGVTLVPLLIILVALMFNARHWLSSLSRLTWPQRGWSAVLAVVLVIPLALNTYTPEWNDFLKEIPIIQSSSNLLRWFMVYVPVVVVVAALMFDVITPQALRKTAMLLLAMGLLIWINATKDREYYRAQHYVAAPMVQAWHSARAGRVPQRIDHIAASFDANHQISIPPGRNDVIAEAGSQLVCYNPIFGYALEHFPIKTLHPGPVMDHQGGVLNLKNPACYTYSKANRCAPGDHFTLGQRPAALAFANYEPFTFAFSIAQSIANMITEFSLGFVLLLMVFGGYTRLRRVTSPMDVETAGRSTS